jgi:hypothetical protein
MIRLLIHIAKLLLYSLFQNGIPLPNNYDPSRSLPLEGWGRGGVIWLNLTAVRQVSPLIAADNKLVPPIPRCPASRWFIEIADTFSPLVPLSIVSFFAVNRYP